ncbi:putative zinc finger [Lyophyllum shimeji]|uniref:Zinc finger n=1 Tax=Lyophyllum shimeji TaxID=47721 RepID=A0A9P3PN21_LYOSH|nr:putative zinc finger [Lyophyllum shimeji]
MYSSYYLNAPVDSVAHLLSNEEQGFEDLLATAAENFPPETKAEYRNSSPMSAPSPICSSSSSESSLHSPDIDHQEEANELHFESDSDVEQLDLDERPIPAHQLRRAPSVYSDEEDFRDVIATLTPTRPKPSGLTRHPRSRHTAPLQDHPYPHSYVSSSSSRRKPVRRLSHFTSNDSDYEPGDDSEGNATDDEYVPSPQLAPSRHRRASPASSTSSRRSTAPSMPSTPHSSANHLGSKPRRMPSSRNEQSSWDVEQLVANADKFNFICPVCDRVQRNRRMPDLKRHLRTHARPSSNDQTKGFWCKGVPLDDADMYGIPPTAERFLFLGEWRKHQLRPPTRDGGLIHAFLRRVYPAILFITLYACT